jgi:hypothetical protein
VTITDFDPGPPGPGTIVDQIELSGFGLDFATLDTNQDGFLTTTDANIVSDGAGGLTLQFGPHDVLTVEHVSTLTVDDLLFS